MILTINIEIVSDTDYDNNPIQFKHVQPIIGTFKLLETFSFDIGTLDEQIRNDVINNLRLKGYQFDI